MTTELADVFEYADGASTYEIFGLGARASAVSAAARLVDDAIAQRVTAARTTLHTWHGAHATTFAERVNEVLGDMVDLHLALVGAAGRLRNFPGAPVDGWAMSMMADQAGASARVEAPAGTGMAGAATADLHAYGTLATAQDETLPPAAASVSLAGVTAVEHYQRPLLAHERQALLDDGVAPPLVALETVGATRPVTDVARLVPLPDLGAVVTPLLAASQSLNVFVAATALAFDQSDQGMLDLLAEYPDLAVGVLDVLADGTVDTAEGALAVLSAEWDLFDTAGEGGDPDGIVSHQDIRAIMENPGDYPPAVVAAATFLERNRRLFTLLETTNDPDGGRDRKVSREDLDLFVEFNDHLRTLNENFDSFADAAGDGSGDSVSTDDLEAVAAAGGPLAATAQWLLDHEDQRERIEGYEAETAAATGRDGGLSVDPGVIGAAALITLAVDQQAYGRYDLATLHLRPGTIPPPPPQPYIDRGAAGEPGQDPWWSTLDDELVEAKWEAVAAGAEAVGQTDAARHLRHYLGGTGDDLALDADRILHEAPSLQATVDGIVAREIARIANADASGEPVAFATDWSGVYLGEDENLFRAIGGVQVSVTGVITVEPPTTPGGEPHVDVDYRVHLYDRYNWDEGDDPATPEVEAGKHTEFPVLGTVQDGEMAELQRAGLAMEFDMRGTSDVYTHEGPVPTPDALPEPPDGRSGRDDPGRDRD